MAGDQREYWRGLFEITESDVYVECELSWGVRSCKAELFLQDYDNSRYAGSDVLALSLSKLLDELGLVEFKCALPRNRSCPISCKAAARKFMPVQVKIRLTAADGAVAQRVACLRVPYHLVKKRESTTAAAEPFEEPVEPPHGNAPDAPAFTRRELSLSPVAVQSEAGIRSIDALVLEPSQLKLFGMRVDSERQVLVIEEEEVKEESSAHTI